MNTPCYRVTVQYGMAPYETEELREPASVKGTTHSDSFPFINIIIVIIVVIIII